MIHEYLADDQIRLLTLMGSRLKEHRKRSHLKQKEVADRLELSRTSISNIETGRQNISVARLYDFCLMYGCTPNDLLK